VFATVTATNVYGESLQSPFGNGACIVLIPDAPVGLQDNTQITSQSVISFKWNKGISHGGSPIIDYRISYDQSIDSFVTLESGIVS
jgi:hypothetical protein